MVHLHIIRGTNLYYYTSFCEHGVMVLVCKDLRISTAGLSP